MSLEGKIVDRYLNKFFTMLDNSAFLGTIKELQRCLRLNNYREYTELLMIAKLRSAIYISIAELVREELTVTFH